MEDAFKDVKLEDGVGLWEGQGLDFYQTKEECQRLREKDEKDDWHNLSLADLYECNSSTSFFDAKGIRFHLPFLMLLDLGVYEKKEEKLEIGEAPDIEFILSNFLDYIDETTTDGIAMLAHHHKLFSLLNSAQIECIIAFLRKKSQKENYQIDKGIQFWKDKLAAQSKD